ncbi:uncharacterized protein LOC117810083 isoform X1 [Xyrichtys novacula]|uniref:Uncharacterized protein LOC117810083 isoform X1 n=1 Tax=Xyrichtys novacula TaxID=13765 RepID=A0AAV1EM95_XYRNO|nr:uncharacterized protein LOC117810083 isoform X1 [Xyrichtys novacula]
MQSPRTTMNMVRTVPITEPTVPFPEVDMLVRQEFDNEWITVRQGPNIRIMMNMVGNIRMIEPTVLLPIVNEFIRKLARNQWITIAHGSLDQGTKDMIRDMCVDIVDTVAKYISIAIENSNSEEGPPKSTEKRISKKEVHAILGDSINFAIADALGIPVDIHSRTTEKVNSIVVEEVTERINSNKEQQATKSFCYRLKDMARKIRKIIVTNYKFACNFALNGLCCPTTINSLTCTNTQVEEEDVKEEEPVGDHFQTPVTPFVEDEPEMFHKESLKHETLKAVKSILSKHTDYLDGTDIEDDLSEEELSKHLSISDRDTDETASEIVKIVWGDNVSQEPEASPVKETTPPAKAKKARQRNIMRRIKMFLTKRFAKKSIIKLFRKLTGKISVEERDSVMTPLMTGVSTIVDDMIEETGRECTNVMCFYRRMARNITEDQFEEKKNQLVAFVLFQLMNREKKQKLFSAGVIRTEVDQFMKMMWNWLVAQAEKHNRGKDQATAALRQIEAVVYENQAFPKIQTTKISQSAATPAPVTEETNISEEAELSGGAWLDYWDRLRCEMLVAGLVKMLMDTWRIYVKEDQAISVLTEALWAEMEGSEVEVKLSFADMRKIVRKVHKKLSKELDIELIKFTVVQDPKVLTHIIEAFKEELSPKQKSGFKGFFKSVFKPFTRIFKRD